VVSQPKVLFANGSRMTLFGIIGLPAKSTPALLRDVTQLDVSAGHGALAQQRWRAITAEVISAGEHRGSSPLSSTGDNAVFSDLI
jgi:hypothetical protein